jgi:hypothetical protein
MVGRQDVEKRRAWEVQFERFRASGFSVARYCEQERVSANMIFYWAKRVGSPSARPRMSGAGMAPRRSCPSVKPPATAGEMANAALVRFSLNGGVEVLVPADCLDVNRPCPPKSRRTARILLDLPRWPNRPTRPISRLGTRQEM